MPEQRQSHDKKSYIAEQRRYTTSSDTNVTQLPALTEAEVYIFRGRGVFIDVYKADDKIASSGAMSLTDIDLRRTYIAIDSVSTGRIPSLFCGYIQYHVF